MALIWCDLPKDLPPYSTVFWHYKQWRAEGVFTQLLDSELHLGWLINPQNKQVEICRLNRAIEVLQQPETLSSEDVLPGFVLRLQKVWMTL